MRQLLPAPMVLVLLLNCQLVWAETLSGGVPVVVVIEGDISLDSDEVRRVIGEELGTSALRLDSPAARSARGTLTIIRGAEDELMFQYHRAQGGDIWRTLRGEAGLPTLEAVALLAGNLVRDQAEEILADLTANPHESLDEPAADLTSNPLPPPEDSTSVGPSCPQCSTVDSNCLEDVTPSSSERSWTDPWAIDLTVFQAAYGHSASTFFDVRAGRRWHAYGLGGVLRSGLLTACTWAECLLVGQQVAMIEAEVRFRTARVIMELGLGLGLSVHEFATRHGANPKSSFAGRLRLSLVIPVSDSIDVLVSNELATTFRSVESPGFYDTVILSPRELGFGIGVRLRPF